MISRSVIGLTGGIATGKSTVCRYLAERYQIPILDADLYARAAVQPGSPILRAITQRYGPDILLLEGQLHRARLGEIVFNNAVEKAWLEAQIHPYVRDRFAQAVQQIPAEQTVVQAIPLLFEANLTNQVSEIWVVTCSAATQLKRLMQRDRLSLQQAQARIASQMPLVEKVARADSVLNNDGDLSSLQAQVDAAIAVVPYINSQITQ
ncbi:MAG: dephospho-CoA kinase [Leptolyngbyaceae cyanobacterium SL_1_1]|nr:dephospho-CoA kinase [Leptolyngbyaceae cyanobacterium RM1_1_2]NJO08961.1 dephospho-CoA kinase [Leptolyngbyaceae cyanobacterium SL_1_1]